jgi:hypothetical protein
MARLKKQYAALPTHKLRNKVWARAVKLNLLPDSDPARPLAHLICDALNKRRIEDGKLSLGRFFTPTRWIDWWNGAHPTPGKYTTIASVVMDSPGWFEAHIANQDEHPLHTLLYAMDLLGKPVNELAAFEVLISLQNKWGARIRIVNGVMSGNHCSPQFPDVTVPSEISARHYSALAPASIIRYMLWLGDAMQVDQRPQHRAWVFDLVSATLCVFTIYSVRGLSATLFSGVDGDVAAMVYRTFTRPNGDINDESEREVIRRKMCASLDIVNSVEQVLPESEMFVALLMRSLALFLDELNKYGISVAEVDLFGLSHFASEMVTNNP